MILFFLQILTCLGLSVGGELVLGPTRYFGIGFLMFVGVIGLWVRKERSYRFEGVVREDASLGFELVVHTFIALYFGLTWISLPLVIWTGRRADAKRAGERGPGAS